MWKSRRNVVFSSGAHARLSAITPLMQNVHCLLPPTNVGTGWLFPRAHDNISAIDFVRQRAAVFSDASRLAFARSFAAHVTIAYWYLDPIRARLSQHPPSSSYYGSLGKQDSSRAQYIAQALRELSFHQAAYQIGCIYTTALPDKYRAERGVFYTPPALCERLLDLATDAGVDWSNCSVLDPACGGAAFLAPVATRMLRELHSEEPTNILANIAARLHGFEVDPFAAWLSQLLVEGALSEVCVRSQTRLPIIVTVRDSLSDVSRREHQFDVVIGNPPYGRVHLSPALRLSYARTLYGHANLYGLFTDAALRWVRCGGVVAFVTPTSMLGGQYYKNLRKTLAAEAPPVAFDLITARTGVFGEVLQETMLAVYRKDLLPRDVQVCFIERTTSGFARPTAVGWFPLPGDDPSGPWILPRSSLHVRFIDRARSMPTRLKDYGYEVSTGPLVWNRHKPQLRREHARGSYPVIWAESVGGAGVFRWRCEKRNHLPWFRALAKDGWLITSMPCVLLQRTTAKEQRRRLIAAELPARFVKLHHAVTVENHLNMIWPKAPKPAVSIRLITALLNTSTIDMVFRCINGSVAVSAYELEALPLPTVSECAGLDAILARGDNVAFEAAVRQIYSENTDATTGVA